MDVLAALLTAREKEKASKAAGKDICGCGRAPSSRGRRPTFQARALCFELSREAYLAERDDDC